MSLTAHRTPNILPVRHTREDYDFDYKDGVSGPIRIDQYGTLAPVSVWCKRHGWEREIIPESWITETDFHSHRPSEYRWRCPTCGESQTSIWYTSSVLAVEGCARHIAKEHDAIVPYRKHKWDSDEHDDPREFMK